MTLYEDRIWGPSRNTMDSEQGKTKQKKKNSLGSKYLQHLEVSDSVRRWSSNLKVFPNITFIELLSSPLCTNHPLLMTLSSFALFSLVLYL